MSAGAAGGPADADDAPEGDDFELPLDAAAAIDPSGAPVRHFLVGTDGNGVRLDKYLAGQMPEVSRSRLQRWIEDDAVLLNGAVARTRAGVYAGDRIDVRAAASEQSLAYGPEPIPIDVVWEDDTIIVVDKPAGLVVHPGAGNWSGTLLNGLLAFDPRLAGVPRAGIVHRLDAGTSGLMVVARTPAAQLDLVRQLQARTVVREYWAVVSGAIAPSLTIDAALGRDPRNPLRFRVSTAENARPARTYVRRLEQWPLARPNGAVGTGGTVSWLACRLDTGRTHQIRVHLESIGHPLLGDPIYRNHLPTEMLAQALPGHALTHQALHACRLELVHPVRQETLSWTRSPPADLRGLLLHLGCPFRSVAAAAARIFCGQPGRHPGASIVSPASVPLPDPQWIQPQWPVPRSVQALITTRAGGVSQGPWGAPGGGGLNLGEGSDDPAAVAQNRRRLRALLPAEPCWLDQVHGAAVVDAATAPHRPRADGAYTRERGVVCCVLIADCLPVLLADAAGRAVAAAHAGWRGLAGGVIQNTAAALRAGLDDPAAPLLAYLGPAIGPAQFEVGAEVLTAMEQGLPDAAQAFTPRGPGKYLADLYALARQALAQAGVGAVYGGGYCTVSDAARFFSYRRESPTGRQAALIWLKNDQAAGG